MTHSRLVIVANRLPYRMAERRGRLSISPSAGGLATSMASYLAHHPQPVPAPWVGASDLSSRAAQRHFPNGQALFHDGHQLEPVTIPKALYEEYYNGACNSLLWPLFHYFPSYARYAQPEFDAYVEVNRLFCAKLLDVVRPGDRIWVHDYHLMLLPALLREALPDTPIAFFLHIPFPSYEVFRLLPESWRRMLLQGPLGADLVGFHTQTYAQHFLHSVQHVLGYDHQLRTVRTPDGVALVDAFPISIDTAHFRTARGTEAVMKERERIADEVQGRRVIFSVDRLDYTKGLPSRLTAYERFLEQHPELHQEVVFVMVVVPSRDRVEQYALLRRELEILISRVNGRYGRIGWTPVVYQYRDLAFEQLVALYASADVALITPMRDGMNLVAKEFVACSEEGRGVLVLSETAGAAEELSGALLVNPNDAQAIADALARALSMPQAEQVERHAEMLRRLEHYDVNAWASDLLGQLDEAYTEQDRMRAKAMGQATVEELTLAYGQAGRRMLFLDHDGTLAPFQRDPALARPSEAVLQLVRKLADDPANSVVIVSGRGTDELDAWFGALNVALSAEHGVFFRGPGGDWTGPGPDAFRWKQALLPLFQMLADRCPGALVQEKTASLSWHYRGAARELGFLRSRELLDRLTGLAPELGFRVTEGNMVIEARPLGMDKGKAVRDVLAAGPYDLVLALGDDRTDEDMFRALPSSAWSIRVGTQPSHARFNLRHQSDVLPLLSRLAEHDRSIVQP